MATDAGEIQPPPEHHELKTWPPFYEAVESGAKPFEVRWDDRTFLPDDVLHLQEWDQTEGYSGRSCWRLVTYVLSLGDFLPSGQGAGYVVMGLADYPGRRPDDG